MLCYVMTETWVISADSLPIHAVCTCMINSADCFDGPFSYLNHHPSCNAWSVLDFSLPYTLLPCQTSNYPTGTGIYLYLQCPSFLTWPILFPECKFYVQINL